MTPEDAQARLAADLAHWVQALDLTLAMMSDNAKGEARATSAAAIHAP